MENTRRTFLQENLFLFKNEPVCNNWWIVCSHYKRSRVNLHFITPHNQNSTFSVKKVDIAIIYSDFSSIDWSFVDIMYIKSKLTGNIFWSYFIYAY